MIWDKLIELVDISNYIGLYFQLLDVLNIFSTKIWDDISNDILVKNFIPNSQIILLQETTTMGIQPPIRLPLQK